MVGQLLPQQGPPAGTGRLGRLVHNLWHGQGPLLIAVAALIFSCQSLCIKLLGGRIPTYQVVLYPAVVCLVLTSAIVHAYGLRVSARTYRVAGLTLGRGLLGAASIICFYASVQVLPLKDAVTLFFCSPVFASFFEWALLGESHGWAGLLGGAATITGVVLVSQPDSVFKHGLHFASGTGGGLRLRGMLLATAAAAANGSAFLIVRLLKQCQPVAVLTLIYHGTVAAVSFVLLLASGGPVRPSRGDTILLVAISGTQFVGQLLLNRGFQLVSATRGSAINVLQVLFSFIFDLAILGDRPGILSALGSCCVAGGVMCVALSTSTHPHTPAAAGAGATGAESPCIAGGEEREGGEGGGGLGGGASPGASGGLGRGGGGQRSLHLQGTGSGGDGSLNEPLLLAVAARLSVDSAT